MNEQDLVSVAQDKHRIANIFIGRDVSKISVTADGEIVSEADCHVGFGVFELSSDFYIPEYGHDVISVLERIKIGRLWKLMHDNKEDLEIDEEEKSRILALAAGMDKILDSVEEHLYPTHQLDKIVIRGEGSRISTIVEAFEHKFGVYTVLDPADAPHPEHASFSSGMLWGRAFLLISSVVLAILVILMTWITFQKINEEGKLRSELSALNVRTSEIKNSDSAAALEDKKELIQELRMRKEALCELLDRTSRGIPFGRSFLDSLNDRVPMNIMIHFIDVNGGVVTLSGVAMQHSDIAQFAYNLRDADQFENIRLGTIKSESSGYGFVITFELMEEAEHEK